MSLCVLAAGKTLAIAASVFTLAWTHSIEKVSWQESWRVTPAGLEIESARVQGSGAGMEPPDGSVFEDGWWIYRPDLPAQPRLVLAASGATPGGWRLCADGECLTLGAEAAEPIVLEPCAQ